MRNFTNPLDNVRIASPCSADWNEMYGNDRQRFCGDCKLNVYNLSDMTRQEAENLLINSEGRLCVRFFRRADGTVLAKNCPVGWKAVKQRVSRVATAAFSMIAGIFTGVFGFSMLSRISDPKPVSSSSRTLGEIYQIPVKQETLPPVEMKGEIAEPAYLGRFVAPDEDASQNDNGAFEVGVTIREEPKTKPRSSSKRR
jgi:hypothetical protein